MIFQIGSSSDSSHGGRRKLPFVYTEQGIAMLSAVLRSDVAIQVSIRIMQTFVEMRKYLATNALLLQKVNNLETKQLETDLAIKAIEQQTNEKFDKVFDYIASHGEDNQKIFFDGQIFDAFSLMTELIQQADNSIVLIDGYVDVAKRSCDYGFGGAISGFAANKDLMAHYINAFDAEPICMLHQYQIFIPEESGKKIQEVYSYEWTDDII